LISRLQFAANAVMRASQISQPISNATAGWNASRA